MCQPPFGVLETSEEYGPTGKAVNEVVSSPKPICPREKNE